MAKRGKFGQGGDHRNDGPNTGPVEEPAEPDTIKLAKKLYEFRDAQTGRFLAGNPGKPHGARWKVNATFGAAMRELNEKVAEGIIDHLLGSPDDAIVFHTWKLLLAYGYGKPPETLNLQSGLSAENVLQELFRKRREKDTAAPEEGAGG